MYNIELIIYCIVLIFGIPLILLAICNRWLSKWACKIFGWHLAPIKQGFDGCSLNGKCSRCNKKVMQDSNGDWFS